MLCWQPSLLGECAIALDPQFSGIIRHELSQGAWVDVSPAWLRGADVLFDRLLQNTQWTQHKIRMYEREMREPRLTSRWHIDDELPEPVFADAARLLSKRYGVRFTQVGVNLYRDGSDSVAWHGDRVAREMEAAHVALISLGAVRPLRLRPRDGGASIAFSMRQGDLLVMGGTCQRTWQHSIPKVRSANARISIQFRHAYRVTN